MLRVKSLTINIVADVTGFLDLHINLVLLGLLILIPILIPDLEICAHLCQSVASKMLPPVAPVLPVEKGNETLVK